MLNIAQAVASYRSVSEDRLAIIHQGAGIIIVIADGAGGIAGGAEAAEIVLGAVRAAIPTLSDLHHPTHWRTLLSDIDAQIEIDHGAGETTAVIAAVSASGITGVSVGDSVAWLITPEGYDDLTQSQERKPLLGSGMAWPIGFQRPQMAGTLLIATDGLVKYATPQSICAVALEPGLEIATQRLIELVRPSSGKLDDDVTVALCRL